jgi:hypothetical protein
MEQDIEQLRTLSRSLGAIQERERILTMLEDYAIRKRNLADAIKAETDIEYLEIGELLGQGIAALEIMSLIRFAEPFPRGKSA